LSTAYTTPLLVNSNVTITAKAFKTGMAYSDTISATYTFVPVVPEFQTVTANILVLAFLTLILLFTKRTYRNNINGETEQKGNFMNSLK
jgi:hypothetical protein